MTIRHLRIFIAVYQEMNITKAAKKLHLAQPSVSLAIKELEKNYNIHLFDRINRRLFITQQGEAFFEYASRIVSLFDEMESDMLSPDMPMSIKLGSSITIGDRIVPHVVKEFSKLYPLCKVFVQISNSQQIISSIKKNELDFGVVEDYVKNEDLVAVPFLQDQLYFVCGNDHPLTMKAKLSLNDICEYPLLMREPGSASREITDGLLKLYQLKPEILWESVSNQALIEAVKENYGIAVLSEKLIQDDLAKREIKILDYRPKVFSRQFNLVYHDKKYQTVALQEFMKLFQNECSSFDNF